MENSFANSLQSVWGMIVERSLIKNVFEILQPGKVLNLLKPELYSRDRIICVSADSLHSFEKDHHKVKQVTIANNGDITYRVETGVITLKDKLISSFFTLPITLLESIAYLLLVPAALLALLLVLSFALLAVPYYGFSPKLERESMRSFFVKLSAGLIVTTGLALVLSIYRAIQAALRVVVGMFLPAAAVATYLLGDAFDITTIQDVENKSVEEIKELGIEILDQRCDVEQVAAPSIPLLKAPSYEDKPISSSPNFNNLKNIPDRYKCPIEIDLMENPVLLSDGFFYEHKAAMRLIHSNNPKSAIIPSVKLTKTYYPLTGLKQEIAAFKQAIQSEYEKAIREEREPNYQPIIDIANKAHKKADAIFKKINASQLSEDESQQRFLVSVAREAKMGTKNFAEKFRALSKENEAKCWKEEANGELQAASFSTVFHQPPAENQVTPGDTQAVLGLNNLSI